MVLRKGEKARASLVVVLRLVHQLAGRFGGGVEGQLLRLAVDLVVVLRVR